MNGPNRAAAARIITKNAPGSLSISIVVCVEENCLLIVEQNFQL